VPTGFTCTVDGSGLVTIEADSGLNYQPSATFDEVTFNFTVNSDAPSGQILNQSSG
jgi:hypothetical protein